MWIPFKKYENLRRERNLLKEGRDSFRKMSKELETELDAAIERDAELKKELADTKKELEKYIALAHQSDAARTRTVRINAKLREENEKLKKAAGEVEA